MTKDECVSAMERGDVVYFGGHPYLIQAVMICRRETRGEDMRYTVVGGCFLRVRLMQARGGHFVRVAPEDVEAALL